MRTVHVPQLPMRFDAATGARVPAVDLNPAAQYGELKIMTATGDPIQEVLAAAQDIESEDYILCVGDVVLTALAINVAGKNNGSVRLLRWDRNKRQYGIAEVELC